MFYKLRLAWVLLGTSVPSGCLPFVTASMTLDEIAAPRVVDGRASQRVEPAKLGEGYEWVFILTVALLAVFTAWRTFRLVRLLGRPDVESWYSLSPQVARVLIMVSFLLGVGSGIYWLVFIRLT